MHPQKHLKHLIAALAIAVLVPAFALADTGPSAVVPNERIVPALDRISWSAVLAGAVVALAIHIALSTLGVGVGAAAVDPYDREHPTKGVPTTILLWMFVSGLIALFAGGWVAGRMAGTVPFDSAINGIVVWSFATVILLILATTTAGAVIGGTFRLLGVGATVAGGAAASVAAAVPGAAKLAKDAVADALPQLDWKSIQREAKAMLHLGNGNGNGNEKAEQGKGNDASKQGNQQGGQGNQQGGQGNQQGKQQDKQGGSLAKLWDDNEDVIELITKAYGAAREGLSNADRDNLLAVVSERAGVSKEEANKTLEKWEKMYREAKQQYDAAVAKAEQKARDIAAATTSAVSRVAVWTFASLVLGVTVAALGGNMGSTYFRL